MSTSRNDDPNKPATGYPYSHPPAQSSYPPPAQVNYHHSGPATGYPYAAPPPTHYYPQNPNPNPYPAPRYVYSPLIRRLIVSMIVMFIIFVGISFVVWLVTRPHLPEFRVDSVSVSGFNASSSQFTGTFDVKFFVRNPNKRMHVFYDRLDGSVFYRNEVLTETGIAPFEQDTRNETTVGAKFAALGTYVEGSLIDRIVEERRRGAVRFNLRLMGWVKFKSGSWRTRYHFMRVFCEDVPIGFSSTSSEAGTLTDGKKECNVNLYGIHGLESSHKA